MKSLLEGLHHRGPDESAQYRFQQLEIGFNRLKIVNSNYHLSSINPDTEEIIVLLNGEIWNCSELIQILALTKNSSEYEIIRAAYLKFGKYFVEKLDGMFCIFLLDKRSSSIFIYRDPIGIKPAFYYQDQDSDNFIFSSDIATIFSTSSIKAEINKNFLINLHIFGFSDNEDCIFTGLRQIRPSHFLEASFNNQEFLYKEVKFRSCKTELSIVTSSVEEQQIAILEAAISKRYYHCDNYPIGLLLSGGIDSSLIAFIAKKLKLENLICFYLGSSDSADYHFAAKVAQLTEYKFVHLPPSTEETILDFPHWIRKTCQMPLCILELCKQIRKSYPNMRVLLCGEGADELYCGYPYYSKSHTILQSFSQCIDIMGGHTNLTNKIESLNLQEMGNLQATQFLRTFLLEDYLTYNHLLPLDAGSMAYSFELRVPFLDLSNVAFAKQLDISHLIGTADRKIILKKILKKLSGISDLEFYNRPKLGLPLATQKLEQSISSLISSELQREITQNAEKFSPYLNTFNQKLFIYFMETIFTKNNGQIPGWLISELYKAAPIDK